LAHIRVALGSHGERIFAEICNVRTHLHRSGSHWEAIVTVFCGVHAHLNPSYCEVIAQQFLFPCEVFRLVRTALGSNWEAMVSVLGGVCVRAHRLGEKLWNKCCYSFECARSFASPVLLFAALALIRITLGSHWGPICCCYVWCLRSFASLWGAIRKLVWLLFVVFALICIALGSNWTVSFAALGVVRTQYHRLGKPPERHLTFTPAVASDLRPTKQLEAIAD
jgi:hypothetical protein